MLVFFTMTMIFTIFQAVTLILQAGGFLFLLSTSLSPFQLHLNDEMPAILTLVSVALLFLGGMHQEIRHPACASYLGLCLGDGCFRLCRNHSFGRAFPFSRGELCLRAWLGLAGFFLLALGGFYHGLEGLR